MAQEFESFEGFDRLSMRMHERLGSKAILVYALLAGVVAVFGAGLEVVTAYQYAGRRIQGVGSVAIAGQFISLVCVTTAAFLTARLLGPAFGFVGSDDRERDAPAAWLAAIRGLDRAVSLGFVLFGLANVPLAFYARSALDLGPAAVPVAFSFMVLFTALAACLDYVAFRRLLRPLIHTIAAHLAEDFEPQYRTPPLRLRLFSVMLVLTTVAGTTAASVGTGDIVSRLALGLGVSGGFVLVYGVLLAFLLTDSVSNPMDELVRATRRVAIGDFSTRVPVVDADDTGSLATAFNHMMRGLTERQTLREAMGSYVDPYVAERVLAEGQMLGGHAVDATVLFVDIRGFTAWCDGRTAEETVAHLNDFFGLVVPILAERGGHANKFMGDGLLAAFGVPTACEDHADRALQASIRVIEAIRARYGEELRVGIGINTGRLVVGSIGGGGRLEFGLIGDVVNVASRVEQCTKDTGDAILFTDATRAALAQEYALVARGATAVRGKTAPVALYALEV